MSSIREVAKHASVSVATVSRALQHPDRVAKKTREKVLQAVEKVGYKPNLMAVKFRAGRTHNLIVLVPTIANVFFSRVINGMQEAADAAGYSLLLGNTMADPDTERKYANFVHSSLADGLIQLRAFNPFSTNSDSNSAVLPMVNACEILPDIPCPSVSLDNREAAKSMVEHLISLGHTRIAMIKGPSSSPLTLDRVQGYKDALADANISFSEKLLYPGNFSLSAGYEATKEMLTDKQRPSALFCENDEMAFGAIHAIKEAGLSVPEDISVAGFDDVEFAQYGSPPLTTVSQPAEEFGRVAVKLLVDLLDGNIGYPPKIYLPFEVKIRKSTGPAPGRVVT